MTNKQVFTFIKTDRKLVKLNFDDILFLNSLVLNDSFFDFSSMKQLITSFQVGNEMTDVEFLFGLGITINFELFTTRVKTRLLESIISFPCSNNFHFES